MGKCVKCNEFVHPDYCIKDTIRGDVVDICVFCYTDKKELTIVDEETDKIKEVITKNQAVKNYKEYLNRLKRESNILKKLNK